MLLSHVGCCMQKVYGAAAPFVVGLWSRGAVAFSLLEQS